MAPRSTATMVGCAGTGFGLLSVAGALWQLYVLVGVLAGVGMSSFYVLSASTVARWFDDRRGLAIALVLVGFNLGYIVAGPLAATLIAYVGWRAAYAILGFGCASMALLSASTVRLLWAGIGLNPSTVVVVAARRGPNGCGPKPSGSTLV